MFEKSLQDLVKGIRAANNDSAAYIAKAIQEIKDELKSRDVTIKSQALQKLTYVSTHTQLFCGGGAARLPHGRVFGLSRLTCAPARPLNSEYNL